MKLDDFNLADFNEGESVSLFVNASTNNIDRGVCSMCSSSYTCSGGGGMCGSAYECSGGGGRCGSSYNCSGS